MKTGFVRAALVAGGLLYVLTGAAMLFAPEWFFQNIGTFPPFNRHYTGDLGSFNLPLGLVMLWAARQPMRHPLLIGLAAAVSLVHALNHAYDDVIAHTPLSGWFGQTIPLLAFALILAAAYRVAVQAQSAS